MRFLRMLWSRLMESIISYEKIILCMDIIARKYLDCQSLLSLVLRPTPR